MAKKSSASLSVVPPDVATVLPAQVAHCQAERVVEGNNAIKACQLVRLVHAPLLSGYVKSIASHEFLAAQSDAIEATLAEGEGDLKTLNRIHATSISIAANAQWIEYAREESGPIYYEKSRIIRGGGDILVWEKFVLDQEALRKAIKEDPSFNNYSHTITKNFYNCHSYQFRKSTVHAYSKDGKQLISYSVPPEESHYRDIVPDSNLDKLMKIICKNK
jgi:hypothetical protein